LKQLYYDIETNNLDLLEEYIYPTPVILENKFITCEASSFRTFSNFSKVPVDRNSSILAAIFDPIPS